MPLGDERRRATYARGSDFPSTSRVTGKALSTERGANGPLVRGARGSGSGAFARVVLKRFPNCASIPLGGVIERVEDGGVGDTATTSTGVRDAAGTGMSRLIGVCSSTIGVVERGGSSATTVPRGCRAPFTAPLHAQPRRADVSMSTFLPV